MKLYNVLLMDNKGDHRLSYSSGATQKIVPMGAFATGLKICDAKKYIKLRQAKNLHRYTYYLQEVKRK